MNFRNVVSGNAENSENFPNGEDVFCDILRAHCQKRGLKEPFPASLSRRTVLSESSARKWLAGDVMPSLSMYYELVRFFGRQFQLDFEAEIGIEHNRVPANKHNDWQGLARDMMALSAAMLDAAHPESRHRNRLNPKLIEILGTVEMVRDSLDGYSHHLKEVINFHREAA